MLFDPTERNVNPFLFPARVRPMKELVLVLTIHDKNVTHGQAGTSVLHQQDRTDAST